MPIEVTQLEGKPPPFSMCPLCDAEIKNGSFVDDGTLWMRGQVQRSRHPWYAPWRTRPHCAVICPACKEIIGWEEPGGSDRRDVKKPFLHRWTWALWMMLVLSGGLLLVRYYGPHQHCERSWCCHAFMFSGPMSEEIKKVRTETLPGLPPDCTDAHTIDTCKWRWGSAAACDCTRDSSDNFTYRNMEAMDMPVNGYPRR